MERETSMDAKCPWCGAHIVVSGVADPEVTWQACNCTVDLYGWPSIEEEWRYRQSYVADGYTVTDWIGNA